MTTLPQGPDLAMFSDEELAEERDFLLRSLQDLEAEFGAGDVDPHDYEVLKDGYTARAAAVLRQLDGRRVEAETGELPPDVGVDAEPEPGRGRRRGRVALVVAAVAVFAIGAGLLVAHSSGQRLPGDSVSGSTPNSKEQQLLVQAGNQVQSNDILGALKSYQQVLGMDPRNVEALAGQGWLIAITGNTANDQALLDRGLTSIQSAEQIDPSYAAAHFFSGSILLDEGRAKEAVTEFEEYLADDSTSAQAALVRQDLQTAQALAAGKLPAGATAVPRTAPTTTPRTTTTTR